MTDGPYIAEAAMLIGDPARANMLAALLSGQAMTATELGLEAHVAPSTASGHLSKLVDGKLVLVTVSGRHRYFRLASPGVARVLEELMALASDGPRRHRPKSRCGEAMARARTCYDHLAGELGVTLAQALEERGLVVAGEGKRLEVTAAGGRWFSQQFEMDTARLVPGRHGIARRCLDWTERRHHIAGPLGAALLNRFRELGWVTQAADSARAVKLSRRGARALARALDITL